MPGMQLTHVLPRVMCVVQASPGRCWATKWRWWGCGPPSLTSHPMSTGTWPSAAGCRSQRKGGCTGVCELTVPSNLLQQSAGCSFSCSSATMVHRLTGKPPSGGVPTSTKMKHTLPRHWLANTAAAGACTRHDLAWLCVLHPRAQAHVCGDPAHPDQAAAEAGRPHAGAGALPAAAQPASAAGAGAGAGSHGGGLAGGGADRQRRQHHAGAAEKRTACTETLICGCTGAGIINPAGHASRVGCMKTTLPLPSPRGHATTG